MIRKLDPNRREAFLQAALRLFVANGVRNTTTAEIAREAGTAAGTLFLYFPTKQDLINELILKVSKEQSDYIKSLLEPTLSARDMFSTIWDGVVRWFLENMDAYRYARQVRDSGVVADIVIQETAKYFDFYYTAIQKGYAEGSVKTYPPDLIGGFLYYDIIATMDLVLAQTEPAKQAESTRLGFEIFWDGIKAVR